MNNVAQIQRVVVGFFVALDSFDVDRAISFFTDDIEWIRESGVLRGHEAARCALLMRSPQRRTRHLVTNVDIEQHDQTSAQARCDILVYQGVAVENSHPVLIKGPEVLLSNVDYLVLQQSQWKIHRKAPSTIFRFGL